MRIGLVVNRLEDYALPVVSGLAEVLDAAGAGLLVLVLPVGAPVGAPGGGSWLRRLVRAGAVDAVAVTGVVDPVSGASCVDDLLEQVVGVPALTLGVGDHGVPDVGCDDAAGGTTAAGHLFALGRRRPLVVAGLPDSPSSTERERAFTEELVRRGLPRAAVRVVRADHSRELAYRRTLELLRRPGARGTAPVDAVFAVNDEMALGALHALEVHGLRVPQDVSVVGFDDTAGAAASRPALTSVGQHLHEQGRRAARTLLDQLAGREVPPRTRTGAHLVVRASCSPTGAPDGAPAPPTAEEVERLHAAGEELEGTRALVALHQGLLGAVSEGELVDELVALVPRTAVSRAHVARTRRGAAGLLYCQGDEGVETGGGGGVFRPEELLPAELRGRLDRGTSVVHLLVHGERESGVLVYAQDRLDRWTGQALQQGLSSALAALARTEELSEHAAHLERVVAARTAQLQAEVVDRRTAQVQLQEANARLRAALHVDGLTGVQNRTAFDEALDAAWSRHERDGEPLSVLMCDVDRFKAYNDAAGHLAGDACLRAVAARIAGAVRGRDDVVARFGGEEFVVLLPGADAAGAHAIATRVLAGVRAAALPHPGGGADGAVSLSIGCSTSAWPDPLPGAVALVDRADRALYRAKADGRDRVAGGPGHLPRSSPLHA